MEVNIELSLELKKKYRHRIRQCYKNAKELLNNNEVDTVVYGYARTEKSNTLIRHCWGIKENKIIDSSYRKNELLNTEYFNMFELNKNDYHKAMLKTSGNAMLEFNIKLENEFKEKLINDLGVLYFI